MNTNIVNIVVATFLFTGFSVANAADRVTQLEPSFITKNAVKNNEKIATLQQEVFDAKTLQ